MSIMIQPSDYDDININPNHFVQESYTVPVMIGKTDFQSVRDWMKAIGQEVPKNLTVPDADTIKLRIALIEEELLELKEALDYVDPCDETCVCGNCSCEGSVDPKRVDIIEVADALTDIIYVVHGMGATFGIDMDKCFDEVQKSNDTKVVDGFKRPSDGKWMKGPSYVPPDLKKVLESQADME